MRLTAEVYRERKWGNFPALRKALENELVQAIPSEEAGRESEPQEPVEPIQEPEEPAEEEESEDC